MIKGSIKNLYLAGDFDIVTKHIHPPAQVLKRKAKQKHDSNGDE